MSNIFVEYVRVEVAIYEVTGALVQEDLEKEPPWGEAGC
jgi:hypothetical protein